jgi:rhodanese-related sulfurtransferase
VALEALGWGDVTCLKGGSYGGWLAEGYAFVEGLQPEAEVLNAVEIDETALAFWDAVLTSIPDGYGGIKADAFNASLVENPDIFVIDARTAAEVEEKGLIEAENWVNIPVQDFLANTDLLPADPDTPIIVYCGSGHRSTQFMPMLWAYGYTDVLSLKSGFGGWVTAGFPVAEYAAP